MKRLFAHRGMSGIAPENTIAAFSKCKSYGLKWVECDLDILGDGTIVLSHDATLDRCTDQVGRLSKLTKNDLDTIDAGAWFSEQFRGERLPTLDAFIECVNQFKLNVNLEIKTCQGGVKFTEALIQGTIAALPRFHSECGIIVSSFDPDVLIQFKAASPTTSIACLFEAEQCSKDWQSIAQACQAEFIHLANRGLTQKKVDEVHKAGYEIGVYTVNTLKRARQLARWGVAGIFTDNGHEFSLEDIHAQ